MSHLVSHVLVLTRGVVVVVGLGGMATVDFCRLLWLSLLPRGSESSIVIAGTLGGSLAIAQPALAAALLLRGVFIHLVNRRVHRSGAEGTALRADTSLCRVVTKYADSTLVDTKCDGLRTNVLVTSHMEV